MNKTHRSERQRLFLIQGLPAPLKPADSHLQIFDNYIENTRLRLRSIRSPETKEWTFVLQQRIAENPAHTLIGEIFLNDAEHHAFEIFEGREIRNNERVESNEIRKNRYFYETKKKILEIDVYLGDLWGLNLARAVYEKKGELRDFEIPPFAVAEVTDNPFFLGENLVGKKFADVRAEFEKIRGQN